MADRRILQVVHVCRTQVRFRISNENKDPKFRELRRKKFLKISIPDHELMRKMQAKDDVAPERIRSMMAAMGLASARTWNEHPINMDSMDLVVDPYKPKEDEGAFSSIDSKDKGVRKQLSEGVSSVGEKAVDYYKGTRKGTKVLRDYLEDFKEEIFAAYAKDLYLNGQAALVSRNETDIQRYFTEFAYRTIWLQMKNKSLRWEWTETLEPPKVVHVRTTDAFSKGDKFGQVTVRFHSKQKLAIYDQFGHLMMGNESVARDVLEYVVFERHLADKHGRWRIHAKIFPASSYKDREPLLKTYKKPPSQEVHDSSPPPPGAQEEIKEENRQRA